MGDVCRSGCRSRDHASYGECLRAARISIAPSETNSKVVMSELNAYADARRQGIQPASTAKASVDAAVQVSEKVGAAWDASTNTFKGA